MNDLTLAVIDGEPRIDSRLIATELGVEARATHQLVDNYGDNCVGNCVDKPMYN